MPIGCENVKIFTLLLLQKRTSHTRVRLYMTCKVDQVQSNLVMSNYTRGETITRRFSFILSILKTIHEILHSATKTFIDTQTDKHILPLSTHMMM